MGARQVEGFEPRSHRAPLAFSRDPYGFIHENKNFFPIFQPALLWLDSICEPIRKFVCVGRVAHGSFVVFGWSQHRDEPAQLDLLKKNRVGPVQQKKSGGESDCHKNKMTRCAGSAHFSKKSSRYISRSTNDTIKIERKTLYGCMLVLACHKIGGQCEL